jgi:hypothetical protein
MRVFNKTIQAQFIPNNFTFDKTCKVTMHDDAQKEKNKQFLIGDFSGSLQSTPLTRDLAPRSTLM